MMVSPVTWTLLIVAAAAAAAATAATVTAGFRLTVLHANDVHSWYEERCGDTGCFGGFARLRAALDGERALAAADGAPAVFLLAGDVFFGTPFYDELGWEPAADLVGRLGVDAMCLGNHEFQNGPKGLAPFLSSTNMSSIPIVAANIDTKGEPSLTNIRPSAVLTVNNRTVGVIGYLTPLVQSLNDIGNVKVYDELHTVEAEVAKLKKSGVEFIIALGHSGLEMDRKVASQVAGIDAVVGGHSHSYLYTGLPQDTETPVGPYPIIERRGEQIVPVVQAYAFTKYLGKLVLTFNSENRLINAVGGPIFLDQTISQDANTLEKVKYYRRLLDKKQVKKIVGTARVFLDGNCKCKETNLGDLIADSFVRVNLNALNHVVSTSWTDASIAVTVSSSIQSSINASKTHGLIYNTDVINVLPYKTDLWKVTVNGSTVLQALEHSASLYGYVNCAIPEKNIFGGFLQVAGMRVVYDMKKKVGSRVQFVSVRCSECTVPSYEPINLEKLYKLIMPKYVAEGGDDYKMIKNGIIIKEDLNITETGAFQVYLEEMSPIWTEMDNRIKIIN